MNVHEFPAIYYQIKLCQGGSIIPDQNREPLSRCNIQEYFEALGNWGGTKASKLQDLENPFQLKNTIFVLWKINLANFPLSIVLLGGAQSSSLSLLSNFCLKLFITSLLLSSVEYSQKFLRATFSNFKFLISQAWIRKYSPKLLWATFSNFNKSLNSVDWRKPFWRKG